MCYNLIAYGSSQWVGCDSWSLAWDSNLCVWAHLSDAVWAGGKGSGAGGGGGVGERAGGVGGGVGEGGGGVC